MATPDVSRETDTSNYQVMDALAAELGELAGLIAYRVGAWQDFGYTDPPTPDSKTIPPLGERSATAIKSGHGAVMAIDELDGKLGRLRAQLVAELRKDEDIRAVRVDKLLAESRERRGPARPPDPPRSCECPEDEGTVRHQRATCTDPVVAKLDWFAG